jgi:D-alanyl-D-alanine dipeptidase
MRTILVLAVSLVAGCAHAQAPDEMDSSGFAYAERMIPGLLLDMKYVGDDNFLGRPVAGYAAPSCLLTTDTVVALARAQQRLQEFGLGLKVFDCYRPKRAVADFVAWAKDLSDQSRKAEHYPNVDKTRLFDLGYIAERSGHSRGSTVDLTLVDARDGKEVDMGGQYDLFDTASWPSDQTVSTQARANRMLLQDVMGEAGFKPLKEEWWHFTLRDEPYPQTYFDFPVR